MNARLPRIPVLDGRVQAAGVWIDPAVIGIHEARRRVLTLWTPRCRVLEAHGGTLVLFEASRVLFSDATPGTLLTALPGGGLTSCALSPRERDALTPSEGTWIHALAGQLQRTSLDSLPAVDPSCWLDTGDWAEVTLRPLVSPRPRAIPEATLVHEDVTHDVHALLGDKAPDISPERTEFLTALKERPNTPSGPGLLERLRRLFGGVPAIDDAPALPPATKPTEPAPQSWLSRMYQTMVLRSPLARAIGRRQAAFLERTMRLFAEGNIDEALRHAIPFSDLKGTPKPSSLSVPRPRASLELRATTGPGASTSINMEGPLFDRFKEIYRETAQKLEAAGRVEEAAYVYFELLAANDDGIALLERHGKYALAASMAHGRDLEPGLVIRLWFLAKRPDKAILVAKRTGAFADAITRLRDNPEEALRLRLLWGDRLAQAGDYAAAVDAVWPAPAGRQLALAWIDRVIAFGGTPAARMLARKLHAWQDQPAVAEQADAALLALAQRDDPAAAAERLEFASAWTAQSKAGIAHRPAFDALTRRMMLDGCPHTVIDPLLSRGVDPLLASDVVRAHAAERPVDPPIEHPRVFTPNDRGQLRPTDAVVLPNGTFLVALGEAGLQHLARDGRVLRRYQAPTTTIVLARSGHRAILLHHQGETTRLARLEVDTGHHTPWVDTRLQRWAPQYDGATWYVYDGERVLGLDAQADNLEALWSVGGLPGPCLALTDNGSSMRFALWVDEQAWVYRYAHTSRGPVLRSNTELPLPSGSSVVLADDGTVVATSSRDGRATLTVFPPSGRNGNASCETTARTPAPPRHTHECTTPLVVAYDEAGLIYGAPNQAGVVLRRLDERLRSPLWRLEFVGSEDVGCHTVGPARLVFDSLGRVVLLDANGRIERVVRTQA